MNILIRRGSLGKLNFSLWLALAASGCTAAAPRTLVLSHGPETATALMAAHPPEAGRNVTPYFLEESRHTSRHLIWIRDRETPHFHANHDLVVVLLEGRGTLWLHGQEIPMTVGDVAVIPAGAPHYFVNTGDKPAAAFAVYSPPSDGGDVVPVAP